MFMRTKQCKQFFINLNISVDSTLSPNFNVVGVVMISTALLFDAIIGNVQEKAMREYKANNVEVVLYSYGIGFIYLLIILTLSGNLFPSLRFCATVSQLFKLIAQNQFSIINSLFYFFFICTVPDSNIWLCVSV